MHPKTEGLLESSSYVSDVATSAQFYQKILGLRVISDFGGRGSALQAGDRQVLCAFGNPVYVGSPQLRVRREIHQLFEFRGEIHLRSCFFRFLHLATAIIVRRVNGIVANPISRKYSVPRSVTIVMPARIKPAKAKIFAFSITIE